MSYKHWVCRKGTRTPNGFAKSVCAGRETQFQGKHKTKHTIDQPKQMNSDSVEQQQQQQQQDIRDLGYDPELRPGCIAKSCCKCPYGWIIGGILGILTYLAASCNMYSVIFCDFVDGEEFGSLGLYTYETQDSDEEDGMTPCYRYHQDDKDYLMDGPFKAGRFFATLAVAIGLLVMIVTFAMCCVKLPKAGLRIVLAAYIVCGISSLGALLILASDFGGTADYVDFELAAGGIISIVGAILWTISATILGMFLFIQNFNSRTIVVPAVHNVDSNDTESKIPKEEEEKPKDGEDQAEGFDAVDL